MKFEVIRTVEGLRKICGEWNDLLIQSRANTVFSTWEWLHSWLQVQDNPLSLVTVCVRGDNDELLGIAPFYVMQYSFKGVMRYRTLRILGDTDSGAEYQTWIAKQQDEELVIAAIIDALNSLRSEWDLIWMPNLSAWSGLHEAIIRLMSDAGMRVNQRPTAFAAFALPNEYDEYLKQMSAKRRQQVRRMTRKILADSSVEITRVRSPEELRSALEALFDLHGKRWRAAGENGVFADNPREKAFYRDFASVALQMGWLGMYVLSEDGVPKAVQLGYVYDGVFSQMQEGFDPEYSSHAGNVLRSHVIEECIDNKLREYDFLGGMSEHKRRWLSDEREGLDLLAAWPSLKTMPIMRARVWPTGAHLQPVA